MAEYVLHCFGESGNAYKAALHLQLAGADWEPRFVDFFSGVTRTPEWRANVNVMGEVPVLEHGGERLTQSGVILDYLADSTGKFGPRTSAERREVLRWTLFDNHKFTGYTAVYRFMRSFMKDPNPAVLEFLLGRAKGAWGVLNAHLGDGRLYVTGAHLSIADLSLCGYVFFEDEIGVDWATDYPAIHAWMARIKAQPGWKHPYDLMPRKAASQ